MAQNVTQEGIKMWLEQGAFLRCPKGRLWLWIGLAEAEKIHEKSITYVDFYTTDWQSFGSPSGALEVSLDLLKKLLFACVEGHQPEIRRTDFAEPMIENFQKDFQEIQGKIQRGEIEKAVPVVFATAEKSPSLTERARWILNLLGQPGPQYLYGLWDQTKGILGASPEILFSYEKDQLTSMALAGTCPRSEVANRLPLLKDPKELHEHELVVKDIVQALSKWGFVQRSEVQVLELPTLLHLCSIFQVNCKKPLTEELLKALHPTPALGVSPKNYGISWMKKLHSQENRGVFGAPLTFHIDASTVFSVVSIRNIIWDKESSKIGSGCGIVAGSELQREFSELRHKRSSVFLSLGIE